MRFLVTAGPTREALDPVRFLSNRSSGRMGFALAEAARDKGHDVVLICGPVCLQPPHGVTVTRVVSAAEMCAEVEREVESCDALIMAAAVADWRPSEVRAQKMKKTESAAVIHLERTQDILQQVAPRKGGRCFVGFAAETEHVEAEAMRKLREKGLDLIVANDVTKPGSGFDTETNEVMLFCADGSVEKLPLMPKRAVADRIIAWVERRLASR